MKKGVAQKAVWLGLALCIIASMMAFACGEAEPEAPAPVTPTPAPETPTPVEPAQEKIPYGGDFKILMLGGYRDNIGYPPWTAPGFNPFIPRPAVEGLFFVDEKCEMIPWLCTGWKWSPDGTKLVVSVRKDVKYHDGTDFNAHTVKWGLEKLKASPQPELGSIDSFEVLDDYTLQCNLAVAGMQALDDLHLKGGDAGAAVSPAWVEEHGEEYAVTHACGTGPFRHVYYEQDVGVKYERFDDYWQSGKPYLDSIEFIYMADPVTAKAAFLAGEGHMLVNASPIDARELEEMGEFKVNVCPQTVTGLYHDSANPDSPFYDVRVRQAVSHAIDSQAIVDAIGYGYLRPSNQYAHHLNQMYSEDIKGYPYDPEKAKALLAEAGYPDGFKTTLWYTSGTLLDTTALIVQEYLAKVGIDLKLDVVESGRSRQLMMDGWKNGMMFTGGYQGVGYPPAKTITFYMSVESWAQSPLHPEEVEVQREIALSEIDPQKRQAAVWEMNRLITEEFCTFNPLYEMVNIVAYYPEVHDHRIYDPWQEVWRPQDAWLEQE
jgi:peptide/nickel transport system substrate-binding protein